MCVLLCIVPRALIKIQLQTEYKNMWTKDTQQKSIMQTIQHSLVVGITESGLIECEEVAEVTASEMSLHIVLLVHNTAAQSLLVSLSL